MPILQYIKKPSNNRYLDGEEVEYILDNEIKLRIPYTKINIKISLCELFKNILGSLHYLR